MQHKQNRGVDTVPLLVECQRPGCGAIVPVRCLSVQRRQKYCSLSCSAKVQSGANAAKASAAGVLARKRKVLARIDGMTPLQAWKAGYKVGMNGKLRHIRRRYVLVPRS